MSFAADADPRYGQFTLRTDCPKCGSNVPVNGPLAAVDCEDCDAHVRVPGGLLRDMVDAFETRWPSRRGGDTVTLGELTWRWTFEAALAPPCHACGEPLRVADTDIVCACGATTCVTRAPDTLRDGTPSAQRVFGPTPGGDAGTADVDPVAMSCPQCGAGLTITGAHERMSPCQHCGVTVHLPEAVWRQLHPARMVLPWTVRFEGESSPAKRTREAAKEAEAEKSRRAFRIAAEDRDREEVTARRAEKAAREAEKQAQAAREQAAADRALRLRTLPAVALSWALVPAALGAMTIATGWYTLGIPRFLMRWVLPWAQPYASRIVVAAALGVALVAWFVACVAAAWRTRQPFSGLFPVCVLYLGTSAIPVIGGLFALVYVARHVFGSEPTIDSGKGAVPWTVRFPLAFLLLAVPLYAHVVIAAAINTTLPGLFALMTSG